MRTLSILMGLVLATTVAAQEIIGWGTVPFGTPLEETKRRLGDSAAYEQKEHSGRKLEFLQSNDVVAGQPAKIVYGFDLDRKLSFINIIFRADDKDLGDCKRELEFDGRTNPEPVFEKQTQRDHSRGFWRSDKWDATLVRDDNVRLEISTTHFSLPRFSCHRSPASAASLPVTRSRSSSDIEPAPRARVGGWINSASLIGYAVVSAPTPSVRRQIQVGINDSA